MRRGKRLMVGGGLMVGGRARGRWWRWRGSRVGGGRRSGGSEGGDLVGAHAPDGREIVVDLLGRVGKAAELIQLEGEGGQGAVVG